MINDCIVPNFRDSTKAAIAAGGAGDYHIKIESQNVPADNIATLAAEGPYAFTVHRVQAPEEIFQRLKIVTTADEVLHFYETIHARVDIVDWHPINQIRGAWYGFQHGLGDTRELATGTMAQIETVVLLPTFGKGGITGELVWYRHMAGAEDDHPECGPLARTKTLERHNRLIEAFRGEDVEGIVAAFTERCLSAICDYITESGTLVSLDGREELRNYYKALFQKFRVISVEVVQRVVEDWFVFSELYWTFEVLQGDRKGGVVTCNTAEHAALATDGRMMTRIGHGTAPTLI